MPLMPTSQTSVVADDAGEITIAHNAPVPIISADTIIVKTAIVALNPADSKMTGHLAYAGAVSGYDFAGTVVAIGSSVSRPGLVIGDRVCGAVHGQNPLDLEEGAFQEYVKSPAHAVLKIPDSMSFEDAVTLGVAVGTAGLALFRSLNVPGTIELPTKRPVPVLVHGGSTCVGTLAIQLLKLSGHIPIATCSPHNETLVRSRGAEAVFNYKSPTCVDEIRAYTKNSLRYVLDCIGDAESMTLCHTCMGRAGGRYTALQPYPDWLQTRKTIKGDWVLQMEVLGKKIGWPAPFGRDVSEETRQWASDWFQMVQKLLNDGSLQTHPVRVMPEGFQGIRDGMDLLRSNKVSGAKLVYPLPYSA